MIEWTAMDDPYISGCRGFVGKYIFFKCFWDSCRNSENKDLPYKLTCSLPGLKPVLGYFRTEIEAHSRVDAVLKFWLSGVGLTETRKEVAK